MNLNEKQLAKIRDGRGFIAALDQSGGSTPKALADYGIQEDAWDSEEEMFNLVHKMRARIISNEAFDGDKILGAILFIQTMEREVEGMPTAAYLWEKKNIVPFLKVDNGLAEQESGVQMMKDIDDLDEKLKKAREAGIFGTKMRSVIHEASKAGIEAIAQQQFQYARRICEAGLVPIVEPEVSIKSEEKEDCEMMLQEFVMKQLDELPPEYIVMLKLTLPENMGDHIPYMQHPRVLRVVALSGGYDREDANNRLEKNSGLIASFSRALLEGLTARQSEEEFTRTLGKSIESIYRASIT